MDNKEIIKVLKDIKKELQGIHKVLKPKEMNVNVTFSNESHSEEVANKIKEVLKNEIKSTPLLGDSDHGVCLDKKPTKCII